MNVDRLAFLEWCLRQEAAAVPYLWGGKDPARGLDCSGLVTAGLHALGGPDWRQTHSSARLFDELEVTEKPAPGDLAFYGPPHRITHVMVVVGDGRVMGAAGGGSGTTSLEIARRQGARVKFKTKHNYRPDFRGFRRLPLQEDAHGAEAGK